MFRHLQVVAFKSATRSFALNSILLQMLAVHVPENTAVDEPWNRSKFVGGTVPPTTENIYYVSRW